MQRFPAAAGLRRFTPVHVRDGGDAVVLMAEKKDGVRRSIWALKSGMRAGPSLILNPALALALTPSTSRLLTICKLRSHLHTHPPSHLLYLPPPPFHFPPFHRAPQARASTPTPESPRLSPTAAYVSVLVFSHRIPHGGMRGPTARAREDREDPADAAGTGSAFRGR
ncbi:hypothetical protein SVAN01_09008 [Stagonosporopsis vannaccii]|nr:hypothetical protein SVAN01_09008 [Stagonosporopsis vannaccii]